MKISRIIFSLSIFIFLIPKSYAGIAVTPSREEVTLKTGFSYDSAYNVRNDFNSPVDVRVETKDWFVLPENKEKKITVAQWLYVSTGTFRLNPGEGRDVQYKVVVPKDARGSLVGMISFVSSSAETQGINLAISVPVFVTVSGTEKIDWQIESPEFSFIKKKLVVSCSIQNTGNVHLRPKGFVELMSDKKKIGSFDFFEGRPVYPGSGRGVNARSDLELAPGEYGVTLHIFCAGREKTLEKKIIVKESGEIKVL